MEMLFLDVESSGLDGESGILTAYVIIHNDRQYEGFAESLKQEKKLLKQLARTLDSVGNDAALFTWRGEVFDVPFLVTRGLFHGVDMSRLVSFRHIDLARFAERNLRLSRISQTRLCGFLGIGKDVELTGSQMPIRYIKYVSGSKSEREKILQHCVDDVRTLKLIYEKLKPYLLTTV
ncbi:MAG: ribonuclease H-like domain-containing protein, partial [Candidatus Bathyarchaeia archaeon]